MKFLKLAALAVLALVAVLIFNLLRLESAHKAVAAVALPTLDASALAERFAGALRIPTVTVEDTAKVDWSQWPQLHAYLRQSFPKLHAVLEVETVADHSLLYTWHGSDATAAPLLMLGHLDVVPVPDDTLGEWLHQPFAGVVADGHIWGRGALDDKSSVLAKMEAVEQLLAQGFQPKRTLYFAFGHDEETGGEGAVAMASLLQTRGVQAEWALDEGGFITQGLIQGVDRPVAIVPVGEKGYLTLELSAEGEPGHSSMPPDWTAVGRVARAVARLEEQPFPARLTPAIEAMLDRLAPHLPLTSRLAIANRWLLGGVVARSLDARGGAMRSLVRTTTAPTMSQAGTKDNVLPRRATATVNFRILPGDSRESVEARVREVIDDSSVSIQRLAFSSDPSGAPAGIDANGFAVIERSVNEIYPEALVVPSTVIGATDLRHYSAVARFRYNFAPVVLTPPDFSRIHGNNERIAVQDYARMVQFYLRLIPNAAY